MENVPEHANNARKPIYSIYVIKEQYSVIIGASYDINNVSIFYINLYGVCQYLPFYLKKMFVKRKKPDLQTLDENGKCECKGFGKIQIL